MTAERPPNGAASAAERGRRELARGANMGAIGQTRAPSAPGAVPATVRQWVFSAPGQPFTARETPSPSLQPGQVLVQVAGCGVCHTDLGYVYGRVRTNHPLPLTLGHEVSGIVVGASADQGALLGKAVIVPAVIPCNACDLCRRGKGLLCRRQVMPGNDWDGGFADHLAVPGWALAEVPGCAGNPDRPVAQSGVTLAELSIVADAVTTPYQAIVQAGVQPGDLVVAIGVGGVGGFGVQIAAALGATVVAVDVRPERLDLMRRHGARYTIDCKGMDGKEVRERVRAFAKEAAAPETEWKIFETSGTAAGQDLAFKCLTYGATLSVVGFTMDTVAVRLSNLMAFHARALGNWGCHPALYPDALRMVTEGKVAIAPFVKTHPLSEINRVFEALHAHELPYRPVLVPDGR